MMDPQDIPGISPNANWGAGMIAIGLKPKGRYKEPCGRALKICEQIIVTPSLLDKTWQIAKVQGTAKKSIAALVIWLARGRPVSDSRDGVRGGNGPAVDFPELIKIVSDVEQVIQSASASHGIIKNNADGSDLGNDHIPTREDFENALRKSDKGEAAVDNILDMMEGDLLKAGYTLHKDWRSITENNIHIWSRKGSG